MAHHVVDADLVYHALNLQYIDELIEFEEYEDVLQVLGCRKMNREDVLKCLDCPLHSRSASWFLSLYDFLAGEFQSKACQLRDLYIFPISPTRCVSAESTVFYQVTGSAVGILLEG